MIAWYWVMYIILACLHGFQDGFEEPSFGRTCLGIVYTFVWT